MTFPDVDYLKSLSKEEKDRWLLENDFPVTSQYGLDTMAEIIAILERENESRA